MHKPLETKANFDVLNYLLIKCKNYQNLISQDYLSKMQNSLITPFQRQSLVYHLGIVSKLTNQSDLVFELAINYLDCFLSTKKLINTKTFQLLGYLCLNLASEIQGSSIFSVDHIFSITQNLKNYELVSIMKRYLISVLNWNLNIPTCTEIIFYLLDVSVEDLFHSTILKKSGDYIENCLSNYDISRNGSFLIASSIIYLILKESDSLYSNDWLILMCRNFEIFQNQLEDLSLMIQQKSSSNILNN